MIHDGSIGIGRGPFEARVAAAAGHPGLREGTVVALLADNGIDWLVAAAAVERARAVLLPLPVFFTDAQCRHAMDAAGATLLLSDDAVRGSRLFRGPCSTLPGTALQGRQAASADPLARHPALPSGTVLITFTSGSTGAPRGVCLGSEALSRVAQGVSEVASALGIGRHLCLLPLAVLLEQVAGTGAAMRAGATIFAPPLAAVGLSGSSGFDARRALDAMYRHAVHSVILLPQMLQALVDAAAAGASVPRTLRLAAVGGGRVPVALVERARALGLPACEGYGLSECGSVVALALPSDAPGSGMRPLSHVRVGIRPLQSGPPREGGGIDSASDDEEIVVEGRCFLGYLGEAAPRADGPLRTGDLGSIDAAGRLRITGRAGNLLITGFGRNVSPEWPEAELLAQPEIRQAAVFGEGRPWLCAVLVPAPAAGPGPDGSAALAAAVARVNATLPDYARIGGWVVAAAPFTPADGQLTPNGRLRREAILARHGAGLQALYECSQKERQDALP
ncbi:MAG: AMP-binding protein [bacterium]